MIAPIGSFLTRLDAATLGSIDVISAAMAANVGAPLGVAVVIYYGIQGTKVVNGDPTPLHNFVPDLVRIGVTFWLATNMPAFNYYVRDLFFTGLPNALNLAAASAGGIAPNSVNTTAAVFDGIWAQTFRIVGYAWMMVGFSVTGVIMGLAGVLVALLGGLGLAVMALVYIAARITLATLCCVAPVLIACSLFPATRPFLERAVGKAVSLMLLQTLGFIVLQIVLLGDQWFMAQATNAIITASANSAVFAEAIQVLLALTVWLLAGAYAIWQLKALAYSIGSGLALGGPSLLTAILLARAVQGGGSSGSGNGSLSLPAGNTGNYGLDFNRPALAGDSNRISGPVRALPPPPPPALTHSTRRT